MTAGAPEKSKTLSNAPVTEKGSVLGLGVQWWQSSMDESEHTPELRWPLSILIYDQMRSQEPQVKSVLQAVKLPIRRTTWRVEPNGAPDDVVRFVADELGLPVVGEQPRPVLRTRDRFSWAEHLRMVLTSLDFGHAYFEQVYRIQNGQAHIRKLGWRPPRTITEVKVAEDGGLVSILQGATEIPVDRLVAYIQEREGGNWIGRSLLRPAYKPWLLKDRALRVQAQTLERNGLGIPVYEAGPEPDLEGLTPQQISSMVAEEMTKGAQLAQAYRSGDNSGAAIRNGSKLTLTGVQGVLPDADKPIRYYDEQMAAVVLANFLSLSGDKTGSYALGQTFADFFVQSLQTVALDVADISTMHIVEDLVDINFGPEVPAPKVVFDEIGASQPATAEAIKALVDCGAIVPDAPLETFLRTRYNLPAADAATARPRPAPTTTTTQGA